MTAEVLIGCLDAIKEMKSNQSLCIKLKRRCWSLNNYSQNLITKGTVLIISGLASSKSKNILHKNLKK